ENADIEKAGLIISHQLPSVTNSAQTVFQRIATKPVLFILGAQSNTSVFSSSQNVLRVNSSGAIQEAIAQIKPDFYSFNLTEETKLKIHNFAPLLTPFGNYGMKGTNSVLLEQQIGKVPTPMPLLVFGDEGERKIGILAGEGIWRWRLEEFQENSNHTAVDELISKTVQFLSSRDDKRKFKAYVAKNAFDESERIILNAELYNDSYELVNTPDVNISLKNKSGKTYSYLFSKSGNAYTLDAGILPGGEYSFDARTRLGNKTYTANGYFVITEQQSELQQTTANHQLLYAIAKQNNGQMIFPNQLNSLPELIKANENIKTVFYEDRKYEEIINFKLLFFVIAGLLSLEWFSRKRNGEI
ncbi:MAG: hypothetical protein WBP45_13865, partial [Daejeonella sp.]